VQRRRPSGERVVAVRERDGRRAERTKVATPALWPSLRVLLAQKTVKRGRE
jgi:hypothetical protein